MLNFGPNTRVFVAIQPVDLRGSFDALAGHSRRMHANPLDGHVHLFLNRRRPLLKAVWCDRTSWAIFSKRLESGTFQLPTATPGPSTVAIDPAQLAMILEGIDLAAHRRRRYRPSERA
jgi:transposase